VSWLDYLFPLVFLLAAGVGTAIVRSRRTARILEIDPASRQARERIPLPDIAPKLDAPDVAFPLLAPADPLPAVPALLRDPTVDLPDLLDAMARAFAAQARGRLDPSIARNPAVEAEIAARPAAAAVLATAAPTLEAAFADDRWITVQARFEALTERPGDARVYHWREVWGLRRARSEPGWELVSILSCEVRTAEAGPAKIARFTPLPPPGDGQVGREILHAMLAEVLDALSGRPSPADHLVPVLRGDLAFQVARAALDGGGFADLAGALDDARPGAVRREGAREVLPVAVDGHLAGEPAVHFRESWLLVRPGGADESAWKLWRAEPLR
jgi:hypothetical protein